MHPEKPVDDLSPKVLSEAFRLVLHVKGVRHGQLLLDLHIALDL